MMQSMSGFARASGEAGPKGSLGEVVVELKSVNHRFLKTQIRLPPWLSVLEQKLETALKSKFQRGAINATIRVNLKTSSAATLNTDALLDYKVQLEALGLPLDGILRLPGVMASEQPKAESDFVDAVEKTFADALEDLAKARAAEGEALAKVLLSLVDRMQERVDMIKTQASDAIETYESNMNERLHKIFDRHRLDFDEQLLGREVALLIDRCDITEEFDRAELHLERVRSLVKRKGPVGRDLDFMAQELHREANTMSSKSQSVALTTEILAFKTEVERFKEQVQNIE